MQSFRFSEAVNGDHGDVVRGLCGPYVPGKIIFDMAKQCFRRWACPAQGREKTLTAVPVSIA
jgi:hypothetical protein